MVTTLAAASLSAMGATATTHGCIAVMVAVATYINPTDAAGATNSFIAMTMLAAAPTMNSTGMILTLAIAGEATAKVMALRFH